MTRTAVSLVACLTACGSASDGKNTPARSALDTGVSEVTAECPPESLPPQSLRLLTRAEYAHTVDDLFAWLDGDDAATCSAHTDCAVATESCLSGECRPNPCDTLSVAVDSSVASSGDSVVLTGDFTGWAATETEGAVPLAWSESHGLHWAKLTLPEGAHAYKLVVNGTDWLLDPTNPTTADDGSGNQNSLAVLDCSAPSEGGAFTPDVDPLADFPAETRPEEHPFPNSVADGLVTTPRADAYIDAAGILADQVAARPSLLPCSLAVPVAEDSACWSSFIDSLGSRAWRRPLATDERDRLLGLAQSEAQAADGVALMVHALLASPHFLYRTELGEPLEDGRLRLTPWETASLLSYTLWGTAPDHTLLDAAASGQLDSSEGIATQAGRLLDDPRAALRFGTFATAWLGVDAVPTMTRDLTRFPAFDRALGEAMVAEVAERAAAVALSDGGSLRELLTGTDTLVNSELADIYGIDHPGSGWVWTTLPDERPGILGTAAVLTATAHSDQSSPVRRGLFVRQRLLCQELGTPPANAGGVPDVDPDAATRDRFAQHSDDPACSSCHQYIDPVGFGLEHFDSIGAWRDMDGAHPVDAAGSVLGLEGIGLTDETPFYGLSELAPILAGSEAASACFSEMTLRHALGRGPEDAPCAQEALAGLTDPDRSIRDLLLVLVATEAFVHRAPARSGD